MTGRWSTCGSIGTTSPSPTAPYLGHLCAAARALRDAGARPHRRRATALTLRRAGTAPPRRSRRSQSRCASRAAIARTSCPVRRMRVVPPRLRRVQVNIHVRPLVDLRLTVPSPMERIAGCAAAGLRADEQLEPAPPARPPSGWAGTDTRALPAAIAPITSSPFRRPQHGHLADEGGDEAALRAAVDLPGRTIWRIRPSYITATRSDRLNASLWSWVTNTVVTPSGAGCP